MIEALDKLQERLRKLDPKFKGISMANLLKIMFIASLAGLIINAMSGVYGLFMAEDLISFWGIVGIFKLMFTLLFFGTVTIALYIAYIQQRDAEETVNMLRKEMERKMDQQKTISDNKVLSEPQVVLTPFPAPKRRGRPAKTSENTPKEVVNATTAS